jgi:glyoxylase-like metal-dependent hydrolase (beta-lactamase superfamily II)
VYVLADRDRLTLIDGGWAMEDSERRLTEALRSLDFDTADITDILVTHIHHDHYSQAVAIRRKYGARVSLGAQEQPNIDAIAAAAQSGRTPFDAESLRRLGADDLAATLGGRAGGPSPHGSEMSEYPDTWLPDRARVRCGAHDLEAVATPGHTRGHVVYRDPDQGNLFAGDHVLPHITPSIGFEPAGSRWALRDFLQSLRLLRDMPDARLLPAHGPVTDSAHARIDELLEHHAQRLDQILAAVTERGSATAYEAAGALRWTRRELSLTDLDPFDQMLATRETAAHLEVLAWQDRLTLEERDGVVGYARR